MLYQDWLYSLDVHRASTTDERGVREDGGRLETVTLCIYIYIYTMGKDCSTRFGGKLYRRAQRASRADCLLHALLHEMTGDAAWRERFRIDGVGVACAQRADGARLGQAVGAANENEARVPSPTLMTTDAVLTRTAAAHTVTNVVRREAYAA